MALELTRLRPTELARLLNAETPPDGAPIDVRAIRKHQNEAGLQIGEDGRINLVRYAAWLRGRMRAPPAPTASDDRYAKVKDDALARRREISRSGRDIGSIRAVADPERRAGCRDSLQLFCETYNPISFHWAWSEDHLAVIQAIEQSVFSGARLAFAMPRGSGKSTLCWTAFLWAISYGHVLYPFLIGANEEKALEGMGALKKWMQCLDPWVDDFPEISQPAQYIEDSALKARNMLCEGERTFAVWEATRIALPRVPPPPNLDEPGPWAKTSNLVIGVSGLTGHGIRGCLFPHPNGKQVRPDLVLIDDPQTDESAASPKQNADRERLINGAVLGMAGPGKRLPVVLVGTVIRPGDLMARVLDRKRSPFWRGIQMGMFHTMPTNMAEWEKYFEVYRECMGRTVPDIRPANRHYEANREVLDAGGAVSWPERKEPNEVSAIQHGMNILCERGKEAFYAEYQNAPIIEEDSEAVQLKPAEVAGKLNQILRGIVPKTAVHVTAFVDVHDHILYWIVVAWDEDFTGYVTDYGTYPKQPVAYFSQADPPVRLGTIHPKTEKQGAILAGLEEICNRLVTTDWKREDNAVMRIGRLLVDSKYETELIKSFCRRSPHAAVVMPSQGFYIRPGVNWRSYFANKPGGQTGYHWRIPPPEDGSRRVLIDADSFKAMAVERLRVAKGDRGNWSLFGNDPRVHDLLADHFCAEAMEKRTALDGGWKWHFECPPGRDNHWFDGLVGCAAAASMLGVAIPGMERREKKKRMTAAEMAALARRGR